MVQHPAEYPWSSYRRNALGEPDAQVTEHDLYRRLAKDAQVKLAAYRALFNAQIPATMLDAIREATNKAWVLGNARFRERLEAMCERQAAPKSRGGDRKSADFRSQTQINRV
jgi:putative transposase